MNNAILSIKRERENSESKFFVFAFATFGRTKHHFSPQSPYPFQPALRHVDKVGLETHDLIG